MSEGEPIPLNPRAAQEILGAKTEFVEDPRLGEGIKFTLPAGETFEVFTRGDAITAARVDSPEHGGHVVGEPLSFAHGPDWVGVRGTTAEGITLFAAMRKTGDATTRRTGPPELLRAERAVTEALDAQLAASPPSGADTEPPTPTEQGVKVEFTGNIGREPTVFTVHGRKRVKLVVGEHHQQMQTPRPGTTWSAESQEQTTWHTVWTIDRIGPRVAGMVERGTLAKGVAVQVKGYQHEQAPEHPDGKPTPFVRAFMVSPVRKQQPGS